ncbi:MAG: hypothetical protein ACKOEM_18375 [Planctomycetia bacterium]
MNALPQQSRFARRWHAALGFAGCLAAAGQGAAEDLFQKLGGYELSPIVTHPAEPSTGEEPAADAVPTGYDLARFFPDLRMVPILAATVVAGEVAAEDSAPGHRDFAAIVEEAKREAMAAARSGKGSVAERLPEPAPRRGTPATFASHARPHCRQHGRPQTTQPCPPTKPGMAQPAIPQPGMPRVAPEAGSVPPFDTQADTAVPSLPGVQQALPPARSLARADVGGQRANWSDAPFLVGDGGGPMQTAGRISLGRIMIEAPGLDSSLSGGSQAQLNLITNPQFNNIQAIAPTYPSFTLPTQSLGGVPGTPPNNLQGTPGVGTVSNPGGLYQSAAQNAFDTNPALPGTNGKLGTATFDQTASGALPNGSVNDAFLFYDFVVDSAVLLPGYAVGFVKLTENVSPLPRDRVYMNYSYFRNANFFGDRADVNRFMPGFEKTFADGWTSVEIRTPFAATLDNFQEINYVGDVPQMSEYRDVQFGNISVIFKTLLVEQKTWAITGGVQVMLPTAADTFVDGPSATLPADEKIQLVYVANESVHVMPFAGAIWAPNDRFFNQALFQIDTDVNGNLAYVNANQDRNARGRGLQQAGRAYYPNFMYLSLGTGYWLYKDDRASFSGFAPVMELHINQAFEAFQPIHYGGFQLGQDTGVLSVINGLVGCNFEWGTRSTLTFAYVTPLGGGVDRFFDGELRAMFNWRFGPQNRLTRTQF